MIHINRRTLLRIISEEIAGAKGTTTPSSEIKKAKQKKRDDDTDKKKGESVKSKPVKHRHYDLATILRNGKGLFIKNKKSDLTYTFVGVENDKFVLEKHNGDQFLVSEKELEAEYELSQ